MLLIEAGDDDGDTLYEQVPAYNYASSEYPNMQWNYYVNHWENETQQERDSKLVWKTRDGSTYVGRTPPDGSVKLGIWYPRAGTLVSVYMSSNFGNAAYKLRNYHKGGCGQHNALISIYPFNSDWDNVAEITGDASWESGNMRQYFERLENIHYSPPSLQGHGTSGWLGTTLPQLSMIAQDTQLLSLITAAANGFGAGLKTVISTLKQLNSVISPDINSDDAGRDQRQTLYEYPNAVTNAKRSGPRNFVMSVANATNPDGTKKYHLDIRMNCLVTKIRFGRGTNGKPRALGVDFLDGQSLYSADPRWNESVVGIPGSVNASKEVIISAGSFNTPQILKLSGIGPKAELDSLGIPIVHDLPGVGTNLQDRYEVGVIGETTQDFEIWTGCTFGNPPDPCFDKWQSGNGTDNGPYADNGLAITMIKKSHYSLHNASADLIIGGAPLPFRGYYPGYSADAVKTKKEFTWVILKGHTKNRAGSVTLRSRNPHDTPLIKFRYFDEGTTSDGADIFDLDAVVEGVQFAKGLFKNTTSVNGNGGFKELWPGPFVSTTDQIKQWVRDEAWGHHASCSCPIGADDDPMAVLDSQFRVRGVDGLRVVDASVFPQIPGLFIVVSVYMIGEKAAEVILSSP